jgi:hypothetical protein
VRYHAALVRGEEPEVTPEVFAAASIEGLAHGHDLMFADEAKKQKRPGR